MKAHIPEYEPPEISTTLIDQLFMVIDFYWENIELPETKKIPINFHSHDEKNNFFFIETNFKKDADENYKIFYTIEYKINQVVGTTRDNKTIYFFVDKAIINFSSEDLASGTVTITRFDSEGMAKISLATHKELLSDQALFDIFINLVENILLQLIYVLQNPKINLFHPYLAKIKKLLTDIYGADKFDEIWKVILLELQKKRDESN